MPRVGPGGSDGLPRSLTTSGKPLASNAPTVFNVAYNFRLTWHGAHRTLEEQVEAILRNPRLNNTDWPQLLPKLKRDEAYEAAFRKAYGGAITREAVLDALASYLRALITPNAPVDRYLRGEAQALTETQIQGYALFKAYGCVACHQGRNVGGNLFQRVGVFADYFAWRGGAVTAADLGRFQVTQVERDRHVFRVPSLRNVALTAPYFHDGGVATLEEAVRLMGRLQLGIELPDGDVAPLVAFLEGLSGEYRGRPLATQGARR